jgi:hypothetical protein
MFEKNCDEPHVESETRHECIVACGYDIYQFFLANVNSRLASA